MAFSRRPFAMCCRSNRMNSGTLKFSGFDNTTEMANAIACWLGRFGGIGEEPAGVSSAMLVCMLDVT